MFKKFVYLCVYVENEKFFNVCTSKFSSFMQRIFLVSFIYISQVHFTQERNTLYEFAMETFINLMSSFFNHSINYPQFILICSNERIKGNYSLFFAMFKESIFKIAIMKFPFLPSSFLLCILIELSLTKRKLWQLYFSFETFQ